MTCPSIERLAEWLEQGRTDERGLREHIQGCARCSRELARLRALTAQLSRVTLAEPAAAFSGELATKLQRSRSSPSRPWIAGAAMLAACALLALWRWDDAQSFRARGGSSAAASRVGFEVHVHSPGHTPVLLGDACVAANSGYSFVVFNRTGRARFLMLFALDARREVHWFYPAYLDAQEDPESIVLAATPQAQELPVGVTPEDIAAGELQFVALFSHESHTVSEIEALIQSGGLAAMSGSDSNAELQVTAARVCR